MHLKQQGFTCIACVPFTKNKERIKNFKETGDSRYIIKMNQIKLQIKHDYGDFKDLNRRTTADKVLCDKAVNIAKNLKYDGYRRRLVLMDYKFLIKGCFTCR